MKKLGTNWITHGLIDFEYKKYLLLAYLQRITSKFNEVKLYPMLSDLIFHYNNLITLKHNKEAIFEQFPKEISKVDLDKFIIVYKENIDNEAFMYEIEQIIDFAIPKIREQLNDGQEIYEFVRESMNIFPVGMISLDKEMGYMLLKYGSNFDTEVYEYKITFFENANDKYRGIKTKFITTFSKTIGNTYESMKRDLIKSQKEFPNPATYVIESKLSFPMRETFLPIAKRTLVRYLSSAA